VYSSINAWTNLYETWHVYHGTWAHFKGVLHKSLSSVGVSVFPLSMSGNGSVYTFPRKRIHAIELLDASSYMRSVSYQRESLCVCLCIGLPLFVGRQQLGKHVPAATKIYWRRGFLCGPQRKAGDQFFSYLRANLVGLILIRVLQTCDHYREERYLCLYNGKRYFS
jgi:hypothetical protein